MKLKIKIITVIGLLTLILSTVAPSVVADGCHFSDEYYHLYEPFQKAVINWDGITETLILASAGQSENLTDMAWVVPIISTTKPNVTAGNISLFEELVTYFTEYIEIYRNGLGYPSGTDGKGNVTVLEIKEVDIYDIVILQATDVSDLLDWLTNNGFKVPDEASAVLETYVKTENCYFIVNKIDLKNRYQNIIDLIENGIITLDFSPYSPSLYWATNQHSYDNFLRIHTFQILCNKQLFEDDYWNDEYQPEYLLNCGFTQDEYDALIHLFSVDDLEFINSITRYSMFSSDAVDSLLLTSELKQKYEEIQTVLKEKLDLIYQYNEVLLQLRQGMATPLKFEFTPPEPYYPLIISSLNAGQGVIEVYVVADHPVIDRNNIMTLDKCKMVDEELLNILDEHFSTEYAAYVTRLSYRGMLSDLQDDAVFDFFPISSPERPISTQILDTIQVLISDHHIWGLTEYENGEILEVQYRISENDPWQVIEGDNLWSLELNTLGLQNGEHSISVRFLVQDAYRKISYTNSSSILLHTLDGNAVHEETLQDYDMKITFLISLGIIVCVAACLIFAARKKESLQ